MNAPYPIVIPARLTAQRLPGKPLLEIAGKPLIEHVYRRARAASAQRVVIATDAEEIAIRARSFGAEVVMTRRAPSGSDRCRVRRASSWQTVAANLQARALMPPVWTSPAGRGIQCRAREPLLADTEPTGGGPWSGRHASGRGAVGRSVSPPT
jgi:hypothetical protein